MAEEKGRVRTALNNLSERFRRRRTPEPQMPLWTTGIQEPVIAQGITIPALYSVASENVILRTVITTLQQEIFRRGYYWEKAYHMKCNVCDKDLQDDSHMALCEFCNT